VRIYYFISAFWLGASWHIFLGLVLTAFVIFITKLFNFNFSSNIVGLVLIILALLYSSYCSYNAFTPRVNNISVTIPNLPLAWQGKNIVQISDIHLGAIYRVKHLEKIVSQVNVLHPDLLVITGDFFDGTKGDLNTWLAPLKELKVKEGILFVSGNHDLGSHGMSGSFQDMLLALKNNGVKTLSDEVINFNGLQIIGLNYRAGFKDQDLISVVKNKANFVQGQPTIFLYHTPTNIAAAKELGVNLQLAGHTHRGQLFPFELLVKRIYGRYEYGLNQEGNYSIYTSAGVGTWGPPLRSGNSPEIVNIILK
jgi:hypothetical protein